MISVLYVLLIILMLFAIFNAEYNQDLMIVLMVMWFVIFGLWVINKYM